MRLIDRRILRKVDRFGDSFQRAVARNVRRRGFMTYRQRAVLAAPSRRRVYVDPVLEAGGYYDAYYYDTY